MKTKRFNYTYQPGLMDATDPNVIRGTAIAAGAKVRIAKEHNPPMLPKVFAIIEDKHGNLQSVWKKAVVRIPKDDPMDDYNYVGSKWHY